MAITRIHKIFQPCKTYLPKSFSNLIRSVFTALLTPIFYSWETGHFKSSFKMTAVSKRGNPLPWYTYPAIDFLKNRCFKDKVILEFGGGQSTLWWSHNAKQVVTFEEDPQWYQKLKSTIPANVELHLVVEKQDRHVWISEIEKILSATSLSSFDVIIIDGLCRSSLLDIAFRVRSKEGVIICDNSDGFGIYESTKEHILRRVDFFGNAPGVILPSCTSIFFDAESFLFSPKYTIPKTSGVT